MEKEKYETFKNAVKYSQILSPKNKKEYKKNQIEINSLLKNLNEISEKCNTGLLDLDVLKAQKLSEIKSDLSKLNRQRVILRSKIKSISIDIDEKNIENDFSLLLQYFPNANVKSLSEVEKFHYNIAKILKDEYNKKVSELNGLLNVLNDNIMQLENQQKSIFNAPNIPKTVLDEYAEIKHQLVMVSEANKHYDELENLKQTTSELKKQIENILKDELLNIENQINIRIKNYNNYLYKTMHSAPYIRISDKSHYIFETPNDRGTGSRYKGLILFDLAMLNITAIPAISHDSFMLKQIEDNVLEKLLELYLQNNKQIFITLDKSNSYTEQTRTILNKSSVLNLSSGGNELFGRSWSVISN